MKSQLTSIDFNSKSKFQKVQIIKTIPFGTTLVLDGKTQSAQFDEAVYHEHLVHPAMMMHGNPKSVYIGGGGEYATARDVLKHTSVEKCVMVDIDEVVRSHGFCFRFVALPTMRLTCNHHGWQVCNVCAEHLPQWHGGCLDDPRLEVHFDDAKAFLERTEQKFDVIIMDIADPIEAGPG